MRSPQYERVSLFREATMAGDYSSVRETSSMQEQREPRFNYKPVILRTIPLLVLLLFSVALIGLLEYAVVELPHGDNRLVSGSNSNATRRDLANRYIQQRDESSAIDSTTTAVTSASASQDASAPAAVTQYIQTSNYVDTDRTQTIVATVATSNYVDNDNTQTIVYSAPNSDYVPTATTISNMAIASSNYVETDGTSTIALSASTDDYVPTDKTQTLSTPTPTPTTYVVTSSSASIVRIKASTSAMLITSDGSTVTSHNTIRAHSSTKQIPVTETLVSTPASDAPGSSPTDQQQLNNSGKPGVISYQWHPGNVFLATYLSVVLAVIYRILISIMHNNFTLIEPFRQLTEPDGALAERAFFSFYQNQSNLYGPIPALLKRRWALALVATAYLVASAFPALASEAIWVDTNWNCTYPKEGSKNPCPPQMTVSITVVRILQGLLGFVAVVIVFLMILLLAKRTGLPANPSSIATIASLMRHPGLIEDVYEIPVGTGARVSSMKATMAGKRYKLSTYKSETGSIHYGIRPLTKDINDSSSSVYSKGLGSYTPINTTTSPNPNQWLRLHWLDPLLLILILGTFGVVLAYYLDGNPDGFNNFFSSNTFGPRFVVTGAGTVIATSWRTVEQTSVVMAPYIALSRRPSPAKRTICFTPSNTPILSTWITLKNRYFLPALITFTTLTAEALNIVISGVPFATGQTWGQFLVSSYMSLAILGIMIIVIIIVIIQRRMEPRIPVQPDTLAGKMYYLAGSRVLDDFEGTEWEKESVRDRRFGGLGKRYVFREGMRRDGRRNWLVDEVDQGHEEQVS